MSTPQIVIATAGPRCGFVIAVIPPEGQEHLAPSAQTRSGTTLAVGGIFRISKDEEPEEWRAWLWPSAGGDMHVTQSCEAVDAISVTRLGERLQKRAGKSGPWWGGAS